MITSPYQPMDKTESARGRLLIASCRSGTYLASQVVRQMESSLENNAEQILFMPDLDVSFSDTETTAQLPLDVNGYDVFLFQSLYDPTAGRPVDQNYFAFLVASRALKEWGANHITGVLPYLAYSRQDKSTSSRREPTTAKLMADFTAAAGVDRMMTFHPHLAQIRGFYGPMPVNLLDSMPLWTGEFQRFENNPEVIAVAPDAGASKFVTHFARSLNLRSAIAAKYRPQPEEASISEIIGNFELKRTAIIVDDMISSGGTVYTLARKLIEEKGIEEIYIGAAHNLCLPQAGERLQELYSQGYLRQVIVTDSVPQTQEFLSLPFLQVRSLSIPFSQVIQRIHHNRPVAEVTFQEA